MSPRDPAAFLKIGRAQTGKRSALARIQDSLEFEPPPPEALLREQASRCMGCGIPFCHSACPLTNLIPEWNELAARGHDDEALARLLSTNNFPEFTSRLCPAPCEAACVLAINDQPVTIKQTELFLSERERARGLVPLPAHRRTGTRVAVVGSGPAGLACAQQLARKGHEVVVFEKSDRPGGLLRYGIPDFKMDKALLDARLAQLEAEGVRFECNASFGDDPGTSELVLRFDAVALAIGAGRARTLDVPGHDLAGVLYAMDYLEAQNRAIAHGSESLHHARGKHVVILGGGDTGADCLGTAHRQGAASVTQLEIAEAAPGARSSDNPWPEWPRVFRTSPAHEEGGAREFALMTVRLEGERGVVQRLVTRTAVRGESGFEPGPGEERSFPADLVLIATGFSGPEASSVAALFGLTPPVGALAADARLNVLARGGAPLPHVFALGDARVGASLIVTAIADGRRAAHAIDAFLAGKRLLPLAPSTL